MKIIKVKNYEELSRTAATIIAGTILSKPDCILGLATGSSPVGTYDQLAAMYEDGILDFSHVKSVNLDEYVGLDGSNDQSYRYFMNKNLFSRVNIDIKNTYVPDGTNPECQNSRPFPPLAPAWFSGRSPGFPGRRPAHAKPYPLRSGRPGFA